jgi:hypothetical protein
MKQIILLLILSLFTSCDNGDIEIPSFEFDSMIKSCGSLVLYRLNAEKTEALILHFDPTDLPTTEGITNIAITDSNCNYRVFSGAVSSDYFCSDLPPVSPTVITNWLAVPGEVNNIQISTSEVFLDGLLNGYKHHIELQNLVLEQNNQSITRTLYDFGYYITEL